MSYKAENARQFTVQDPDGDMMRATQFRNGDVVISTAIDDKGNLTADSVILSRDEAHALGEWLMGFNLVGKQGLANALHSQMQAYAHGALVSMGPARFDQIVDGLHDIGVRLINTQEK